MTEIPSLPYWKVINALQRDDFIFIRQKGSHIRLQKQTKDKVIKLTVPAHKSIKKSTLAKIIKDANLTIEEFKNLI